MDIINSLPDSILCHILSFLETKCYVRTSVLARRWRFLWTSVRNLSFVEPSIRSEEAENRIGFADMVYRVLLLHNGSIDSLRISALLNIINRYQIDAWLSTAIARNVQVLSLSSISNELPHCCFKCTTLVELSLDWCNISAKHGVVCLPKLKTLNLVSNYYEDYETLANLVSGCLAIENLVIKVDSEVCDIFSICSHTLKSLVLRFSVTPCGLYHDHKLMLDIPAVQYLWIDGTISFFISVEKLSSLVVAHVRLSDGFHSSEDLDSEDEQNNPEVEEVNISRWRDIFQLVEKLSNAKSLTFRICASMKLWNPTFSFATVRFHNLTKLKLEADWHILTEFLKSAYKLESLTVKKVEGKLKCWREPKDLPECLLSSLKYVCICGFAGGEHELNMVRYILRHAKILKTIKIDSASPDNDSKLNMLQRISYFPRGSKNCRLTFV
ncbi:F-box/FBD/LRR-repeat protein At5g56420-like isoform X1 [Henckelia pumila]|uniref:F-box/FBD/LRR-repeat protein At5g56420-like isoform X1 n=1 Tax=Henckelia pumila TaxID=405737 RepID=UPI003C6EA1BB